MVCRLDQQARLFQLSLFCRLARCENLQEVALLHYNGAEYEEPMHKVNEQKAETGFGKMSCDNMIYDSKMLFRMTSSLGDILFFICLSRLTL